MTTIGSCKRRLFLLLAPFLVSLVGSNARAQGSIFGLVSNSDLSIPATGDLFFVGFLDDTDEEIRVEFCDGAGYGAGNWYDDYQNYLTEGAGNPSDFIFHNLANGEGFHLSYPIPNNSFQEVDIQLESVSWPAQVENLRAARTSDTGAEVRWNYSDGLTYHIFRREFVSNGSFFRIDNPPGDLTDPGVNDSIFIDNDLTPLVRYTYLVIAEDPSGNWSPHSNPVDLPGSTCCQLRGDVNSSGGVDISDITYFVEYMFGGGPPPDCEQQADFDFSGFADISDLTYLIDYAFQGGPVPPTC